jgi:hypothetical protein
MKKILFLIIIILIGFSSCSAYKKSYSERKGFMLLKKYEQPRNKKMTDKKYQHKIKKSQKKYKK